MGSFMACVFYVGPRNSFGQKEQNPTFWLKLFLLTKESSMTFSWHDAVTNQTKTLVLASHDWRIWARFVLSFLINGIGFHFLLHVLPIQVASQTSIMNVVVRAVGMIYLADLDDIAGNTMTVVSRGDERNGAETGYGCEDTSTAADVISAKELDTERQMLVEESVKEFRAKLEALMSGNGASTRRTSPNQINSVTQAMYLSAMHQNEELSEQSALLDHHAP
jgi:hypothetical protein